MSIGFGLERLGFLTLRFPKLVALAATAFTALCLYQIPQIAFDGDILRVYRDSGEMYDRYRKLTETFGTFEEDAYLLVKSPRLTDPEVIERLRSLAFDLELNDYALGTLSPFSLRKPGEGTATVPAVPENMQSPAEVARVLADLRETDPIMRNLIVGDLTGMVMIMFPNAEQTRAPGGTRGMIQSLRDLAADYNSADLQVELTGPPIWTTEMLDASNADQIKFASFGFLIGGVISLIVLRSFWGAVIASLIPGVAIVWTIGSIMMVFGSFTFLTNIVVTLVLVIAFAESMYFCFTWLRLRNDGLNGIDAITEAAKRVLPAAALTSLTTMVSFGTLVVVAGRGIQEFGYSGVIGVALAFVCFSTVMPLIMIVATHLGFRPPREMSIAVTAPIPIARWVARKVPLAVSLLTFVAVAAMAVPYIVIEPRFSFEDFLPADSGAVETARGIDAGVGGVAPFYIRVPLQDGDPNLTDADYALVEKVHKIAEASAGKGKVISGASLFSYSSSGFTREQIFDAVGPFLKRRFVTDDGTQALVTAFLPTIMSAEALKTVIDNTEAGLTAAGIAGAEVTGYRLLTTFASTDIIRSIQQSLTTSMFLNIALIGIAFMSIRIGLVSILPNLLPVLVTVTYLHFNGMGLQLTTVIALTIAFGIAVDDTIHFLATFVRQRQNGLSVTEAVDTSLARVGPALVATTLIICAGASVVVFSALPPVAVFGTLIVLTLLVALVGDLFVLPSLLTAGARFFEPIGGKTNRQGKSYRRAAAAASPKSRQNVKSKPATKTVPAAKSSSRAKSGPAIKARRKPASRTKGNVKGRKA